MLFINAIGAVTPQETFDNQKFLEEVVQHQTEYIRCVEPEYKTLLNPRKLRRMSRVIRMGMYAAKLCLSESKVDMPDGILVGTGLGCLEDTEKFLDSIYVNEEGLVAPTQFIQSTHNTVSSAIALMLKCYNYNFTYVHRGFSFESALVDAMLMAEEIGSANILVGGIDEQTDMYLDVTKKMKMWEADQNKKNHFHKWGQLGNQPGEGAAFFMLGTQLTDNSYAKLAAIKMLYKPNADQIASEIQAFLVEQGMTVSDVDLVCLGLNGQEKKDRIYNQLNQGLFKNSRITYFKHLCGEYKTASSFSMWMGAQILKKQVVPDVIKYAPFDLAEVRNVLIYNNYEDINHSLFLLKSV